MSSPGFAALTLELPARLLADRISFGLCLASAVGVEVVAHRYPGAPFGVGVILGALLLAGAWAALRRRPRPRRALLHVSGAWQLEFADGRRLPARLLGRSRVLGPTLVLSWETEGGACGAWLTVFDLPGGRLREIVVRLRALQPVDRA